MTFQQYCDMMQIGIVHWSKPSLHKLLYRARGTYVMRKEKSNTNQITEGVIWKQLLIFFFPIVIGTFFQQLYNTVDAVIVGRFIGKQALASVGGSAAVLSNLVI